MCVCIAFAIAFFYQLWKWKFYNASSRCMEWRNCSITENNIVNPLRHPSPQWYSLKYLDFYVIFMSNISKLITYSSESVQAALTKIPQTERLRNNRHLLLKVLEAARPRSRYRQIRQCLACRSSWEIQTRRKGPTHNLSPHAEGCALGPAGERDISLFWDFSI